MSSPGDPSWGAAAGEDASAARADGEREWPPGEIAEEPTDGLSEDPAAARSAAPRKAAARASTPRKAAARKRAPRKAPAVSEPSPEPEQEPLVEYLADPPAPAGEAVVEPRGRRGRAVVIAGLSVLLAAAAGLGAAAWNESKADTYQSSAALLVDQGALLTFARDEGIVTKLGALRFKYADQATSSTFARVVGSRINVAPGLVRGALSAQVAPSSLLLRLTATSTDKAQPQVIAQAAAEELAAQVDREQAGAGVAQRARVTLKVVSPAQGAVQVSPSRRRSEELGAGTFGAVLLGAALLRDLTRRRTGPGAPGA